MNYGYAYPDEGNRIVLDPADEPNRYQIQLYHHVASKINIYDLNILEVGSGRGGGAAYISANLHPGLLIGVDISPQAIQFCKKKYALPNLRFLQGDAENLKFDAESFDAVINIESSSHYGNIKTFLAEVKRVLRPRGHLLFADIRQSHEIPPLIKEFQTAGFTLCNHETISPGVVRSLELDEERKTEYLNRKFPKVLHGSLKEFAGTKGSEKYEAFRSSKYEYIVCVLRKEMQLSNVELLS